MRKVTGLGVWLAIVLAGTAGAALGVRFGGLASLDQTVMTDRRGPGYGFGTA